ncbi:MAG: AAA family ATPase [Deltaproteobacteria bacterium]|nr:AAA family ATPase [Deltaproteobacteria bacterium]
MILRSLRLRHFGPFFGECVVDLSPAREASDRPICLIGALNGSGKTSLLDAVVLALYGPRARCSSRGDLSWKDFLYRARNSLAPDAETSEISLTFDYPTAEGTTRYRLVRAWWHTPTSVAESLEVYTQGEGDAERLDHELTETWAGSVSRTSSPLGVSNLFFFDGEQVRALATSDDTTPEVRGAIRTLLGLELPDRLSRDLTIIVQRKLKELGGDEALVAATDLERELARLLAAQQLIEAERAAVSAKVEQARRQLGAERERFVASGGELAAARATWSNSSGARWPRWTPSGRGCASWPEVAALRARRAALGARLKARAR